MANIFEYQNYRKYLNVYYKAVCFTVSGKLFDSTTNISVKGEVVAMRTTMNTTVDSIIICKGTHYEFEHSEFVAS